jgi:AraC-like DNA-binding protein/quercetin dioxygenase-like cupin family protein
VVPNTQTSYKVTSDELCVGGILRAYGCTAEEHEHSEAQLTIVFQGQAANLVTHDEGGRTTRKRIVANSFVFVAPGQPHRVNWKSDGEVLHLWMPKDALIEVAEQTRCPIPTSTLGDCPDRGIYEIGRMVMDEFNTTGGLTLSMINHASSLMVSRVLRVSERFSRETSTGVLNRKRLQPAIDFIGDCPEKDFTLLELASLCNSSVFHFARSFTARMGCAPFAFQRGLRLKKAQLLLLSTELSIEAVSTAVGFENATHFSRIFRREAGYSPREFRRLHAKRN